MSRSLHLAFVAGAMLAASANAAPPVAVVEDASGKSPVGFMDYLAEGQSFALPADASVTISYFGSCQRETIAGGKVTVGRSESTAEGGRLRREKVDCDGGRMLLTAEQASKSGVIAFRGFAPGQKLPEPQFTLYGTTPVVEMKKAGTLVISRLDRSSGEIEVTVAEQDLLHGRFLDLGKMDKTLEPGGLYEARDDVGAVVFKVDPGARPGKGAIVGRLVRLPSGI